MNNLLKVGVILVCGIVLGGLVLLASGGQPPPPVQPIAFDHWIHVTKDEGPQLECTFCHENAGKSPHATIPATSTCMQCHDSIKSDAPEIQKLAAYHQRGEQPPWARVYWLPKSADVFFTHEPHILAKLDCAECHGQVGQMHQVRRESSLGMGWCIDCHKDRGASTDCYTCHR